MSLKHMIMSFWCLSEIWDPYLTTHHSNILGVRLRWVTELGLLILCIVECGRELRQIQQRLSILGMSVTFFLSCSECYDGDQSCWGSGSWAEKHVHNCVRQWGLWEEKVPGTAIFLLKVVFKMLLLNWRPSISQRRRAMCLERGRGTHWPDLCLN